MPPPNSCPSCGNRVSAAARRCPHCQAVLPALDDDDPPPRRLRRREADDDPPPRRLRSRPPAEEFEEPRPRRRPKPDDYDDDDEPRPRRRRPRYEDDDDHEDDYDDRPRRRRGPYAPCPHCRCPGYADKVTFTWWGGLIGPALFSHVTCRKCGRSYNGKTGKDNTTAITIYVVGGAVLTLFAIGLLLVIANIR